MGLLSGIHVLSLVGPQGSGKSSIGKFLAKEWGVLHVEASEEVRRVSGDRPRKEMPQTNVRTKTEPDWLGNAIASRILDVSDDDYIVLTGVREIEVHETLLRDGATLHVIHLDAKGITRFNRHHGVKCSSFTEFAEHENNDRSIGLAAVEEAADWLLDTTNSPDINHAVAQIHDHLGH